ncbi:hypothetical protein LWC34_04880 [Kibdelosporangium philippinense]|uniref:Secreted protein n=1 Tax=Kibdelosporangium philippinense TaxID=211113 RepID=A0ABS8Z2J8_9PSEU|nr:hypothetical protein [Kibdelosporangium philippinense]MCE7002164.1 hypothetical protein [Kibdelosporangium philippinense]
MSKFWLYTVGFTATFGISLTCFTGQGHATPASQGHVEEVVVSTHSDVTAAQEANCGNFKIDKPWGSAEGTVCWNGGQSKGRVLDKKDDGKCVWVRLWYTMQDGSTKMLESPKACGKGAVKTVVNSSPKKSVSVRGNLVHG